MIQLAAAFAALADPTRLDLVRLLAEGPRTATDLFRTLSISQPRASRHLRILREAGLVEASRSGRWVHFRIADDETVRSLVALASGRGRSAPSREPARAPVQRQRAAAGSGRAVSGRIGTTGEASRPAAGAPEAPPPARRGPNPDIEEFLL